MSLHRFRLSLLLAVPLAVGCDRADPLEPRFEAARAGSGPSLSAPSNAGAVAASFSLINVSWQDNSSNENGFEVHRSTTGPSGVFALLASTSASITGYGDGGLTGSTAYCYKVRAFRQSGAKNISYSAFSNVACATTAPPPLPPVAAPSGMTVVPLHSEAVTVSWTDNSSNEDGFRVERSTTSVGPWTPAGTFGPNTTSFTPSGLLSEQQVCYRAFAYNTQGTSLPSNVDCTAPPARPSDLTAVGIAGPAIDLVWTDNSGVEDGYVVWRAGPGAPMTAVADLPANTTAYRDAGVVVDQTYSYEVLAKKDGGFSRRSNTASAASASAPPVPASDVNATPSSSSIVEIAWVDNSTNESGFRLERSTDGGATWVAVATVNGWNSPIADSGLVSEAVVCYRMFAFNNLGDSPPSNGDCTVPPAGPTGLDFFTDSTGLVFDLTWTDNSGVEDGYEVWLSGNCGFYVVATLPANTTSYRYVTEDPYSVGYFYIAATRDGGRSDFSSPPPGGCS